MSDVLLADDHPAILLGIKTYLEQKGHRVIAACTNGIEAFNNILAKRPSIAILDISMPGMTGIEVASKVIQSRMATKVILLTLDKELATFNFAKKIGVSGFLLKDFALDELEECIKSVHKGEPYFSNQLNTSLHVGSKSVHSGIIEQLTFSEKKILQLISEQKSSREIASMLFISEKTVETHRAHIIKKLDIPPVKNALLKWAIENKNQLS
ncbi:DNA-binding response regulator, NarL/FixJ family, contains REC and HTH domains [Arachidicoccus rhizosphaerae]|uniref:DNA-binding response regulator, NarL/FixJ family, contains REC and HTH domains n=1 Tax=Arachidicoccus rhizosphaerae TaxID=551991 RepID=A0A1H3Z6N9_9BACT|nr:response regulator transcription factor [Arachidicoccus rhizosphaerae]SEA19493.1 DNA-binding response regulator, NarL/FixJ family, contains REC and HTH domains [Arachidicoccus rhizosphaerae]